MKKSIAIFSVITVGILAVSCIYILFSALEISFCFALIPSILIGIIAKVTVTKINNES